MYYLCIDLKSFYASVECVSRNLDSLKTKLVVADESRGKGAICLAVSKALKDEGVKNRCRLYEIPANLDYIIAKPRMQLYMEKSAQIYNIYLKYVAKEDIHPYSIDECFIDATPYINLYKTDIFNFAKMLIKRVYQETGIQATCGIGTNLFLSKVALDIMAKKNPTNIGYLDSESFKTNIWHHEPITDIWHISKGIQNRLLKYGVKTLYEVTKIDENLLYQEFGVNAEILIDHSYGKESVKMIDIKGYKSSNESLSSSQILFRDYNYKEAYLVLRSMVENLVLTLVEKKKVTSLVSLSVEYSKEIGLRTGKSLNIHSYTDSLKIIQETFKRLYKATTLKLPIRRISISFGELKVANRRTYNLFSDETFLTKEHNLLECIIDLKDKYGKNSILKGRDLFKESTTIMRNNLIGGHNAN